MRDDLVDLVRESAAEPLDTPDFDAMAARAVRQRTATRVLGGLASALILLVAGVVLWPSTPTGSPIIGDGPVGPTEGASAELPAGWQWVQAGQAQFGVPGDWKVLDTTEDVAAHCSLYYATPPVALTGPAPDPGVRCPAPDVTNPGPGLRATTPTDSADMTPPAEADALDINGWPAQRWTESRTTEVNGETVESQFEVYRVDALDLYVKVRVDSARDLAGQIMATLSPLAGATPTPTPSEGGGGQPYDADAQMRPDLMVVTPNPVTPGETVELIFPEETPRGLGFVLERQLPDSSWDHAFSLTVSPAGRTDIPPQWSLADERLGWDDLGVGGPGPDRAVIPETAEPDDYRICTANAGDEFCAPLRVEGASEVPSGPTESPSEATYSCFGPPCPAAVWSEQEPAAAVEHPGRSVLESNIGPEGLTGWFLLEASEERLAVARERQVVHETGDDMLRTHDVVTVRDFGGETGWHIEQSASCTPQLVHDGIGSASVWLEREPEADSRELELLVVEMACASGESAVGRIELLELDEQQDVVEVAVGVRPREGGGTCPSNPATPFTVSLQQPLGDRTVIDTSVYPPRRLKPASSGVNSD